MTDNFKKSAFFKIGRVIFSDRNVSCNYGRVDFLIRSTVFGRIGRVPMYLSKLMLCEIHKIIKRIFILSKPSKAAK